MMFDQSMNAGTATKINQELQEQRIGPKAQIDGDISCHSVVVLGAVFGNIEADHLEVRAGAKINGDVMYSIIEVHQGSNINGRMVLKNSDKSIISESETATSKKVLTKYPNTKSSLVSGSNQSIKPAERKKGITEQPLNQQPHDHLFFKQI